MLSGTELRSSLPRHLNVTGKWLRLCSAVIQSASQFASHSPPPCHSRAMAATAGGEVPRKVRTVPSNFGVSVTCARNASRGDRLANPVISGNGSLRESTVTLSADNSTAFSLQKLASEAVL